MNKPEREIELELNMEALVNLIRGGIVQLIFDDIKIKIHPSERGVYLTPEKYYRIRQLGASLDFGTDRLTPEEEEEYVVQIARDAIKILRHDRDFKKAETIETLLSMLQTYGFY